MSSLQSRSVLAAIPQLPLDPASGAARTTRALCELLARNGWQVRFVATTGSESGRPLGESFLRDAHGIEAAREPLGGFGGRGILSFTHRNVSYCLLDITGYSINEARSALAAEMDSLVARETERELPRLFLTYGSSEAEVRRRAMVREAGAKVVFLLRNLAYHHQRSFAEVDLIVTPSRFSSEAYRARGGVDTLPLPPCLCIGDVLAPLVEPVFCTLMNPSPEKGLGFFLQLVAATGETRPDIPFLAVESRGSKESLEEAARTLQIDLRRANLRIARNTAEPLRVYAVTRVLLAPSTGPEAAGLVVLEAQLNGIPVIASNRGGLPETVGAGGFVLPVAGPAAVGDWLQLICRLYDQPDFFRGASRASHEAADRYRNGAVDRLYLQVLEDLVAGTVRTRAAD